jgi:hypothetical protein
MVRSLLILSSLALHSLELKQIISPFVNQTIDKIYIGTSHSFVMYTETNISSDTLRQLPILLYRPPHYIILTRSPTYFNVSHEFIYKKDTVVWYNYKEHRVKLWSIINHVWYESCDYPYRSLTKS